MPVTIRVRRVREADADLPPPRYMSDGAAGMDLAAAATVILAPGARALVPTGFAIEIPPGYEGQVRPRSGLAAKHGITVANAPGTIDSDFRGEVQVILVNLSRESFTIERKERIAQLVIAPVVRAQVEVADALSSTARGENGFGSSGR